MATQIWGYSMHKRSLIWIDNRTQWDRGIALEIALNLTDSSSVTALDCGMDVHLAQDASHASQIALAYDHSLIFPIGWVTCIFGDFIRDYNRLADPNDWRKLEHIIFKIPPKDLTLFTKSLDTALMDLNSDYEAKRFNNTTLTMPKVHLARQKLFYDWLKQKNKLGGQHKVPRLSNKRDFMEELLHLNKLME